MRSERVDCVRLMTHYWTLLPAAMHTLTIEALPTSLLREQRKYCARMRCDTEYSLIRRRPIES